MALTVTYCRGSVVIRAEGNLLPADVPRLQAALEWTSRTSKRFTLDLSALTVAEQHDLTEFADTYRKLSDQGLEPVLVTPADLSAAEAVQTAGLARRPAEPPLQC